MYGFHATPLFPAKVSVYLHGNQNNSTIDSLNPITWKYGKSNAGKIPLLFWRSMET